MLGGKGVYVIVSTGNALYFQLAPGHQTDGLYITAVNAGPSLCIRMQGLGLA